MEKAIESHVDDLMTEHGVIGVLCVDNQGLALTAKGTANPIHSGPVLNLAECAKKLYPEIEPQPVICLESDACNLLIRTQDKVTVAIHKVPS
ncbi:ragulator complex protein LAMTOR5 homolog [Exaiptasia diaphana]|uniref:Late endosomal/lysosomal adaptor and MAPK and MTOR activator 5 n=1 Tax=Exaiptasia diaphana TaxID=2652724 RepID=A0A913XT08_EXADI|nr:ragulator complex protein LAMTOR5 homolog [Exaiptasia diaphana]KXJ20085.1 Ragulator complex protein LAMTOR5-like [Exaiptasia diaphana]